MPVLARITTTAQLIAVIAGVYGTVAVVDAIRLTTDAPSGLAFVNLVAWVIPGILGVAYRRELLSVRAALAVGVGMFAVNIGLLLFGPYEVSLVGIESQQLKNMFPPSLLLAGHAIMMCAFAIAAAPAIARWAQRPRVWWLTVIGNTGAMTLYLWHMPALLLIHLAFNYVGLDRFDPAAPDFILISVLQVVIMTAVVGLLFVALRPLENNPLVGWDGGGVVGSSWRSAAVGTLLCIAGAATLASVGWGLKETGLYCVAVMLVAMVAARALASPARHERRVLHHGRDF